MGNLFAATDRFTLQRNGVTHILQVLDEPWVPFPDEYVYHCIDLADDPGVRIRPHLRAACQFIDDALRETGTTVLVHCQMGQSRSASFVIAWLMKKKRCSYQDALAQVQAVRLCAQPNSGFEIELKAWEECVSATPAH